MRRQDLLMACVICTVLVPVLMYAMIMITRTLSGENVVGSDKPKASDDPKVSKDPDASGKHSKEIKGRRS